jgi:hypothetical protein
MKKRLTNVNPLKLGITLGIIYGVMAVVVVIPFFLIMLVAGAAGAHARGQAVPAIFSGIFILFLPILYAVAGFIGGILLAFIYNLVAKWTGGVEFTTEEIQ